LVSFRPAGRGGPASAAEEGSGGVVEFDAGRLGDGEEPAGEVEKVVDIGLLDGLETGNVQPELLDDGSLLLNVGFELLDVC